MEPPGKRQKSTLEVAFSTAVTTKAEYAKVMTQAQGLQRRIQNESGWAWAESEHAILKDKIKALVDSGTQFSESFLTMEAKEVRKQYKDKTHQLEAELDCFNAVMDDHVQAVAVQTRLIMAMRKSRDDIL